VFLNDLCTMKWIVVNWNCYDDVFFSMNLCRKWYSFLKKLLWKSYKQQKIEKDEININCINRKTFIFVGIMSWEVVTCERSHLFIVE
jgi:hypothetical protein